MNNLTARILSLFGIALLAASMTIIFTACPVELDPEIPSELQNTTWTHKSGDKISFTKNSVTIKPSGGQEKTYKLVDTSSISQGGIEQTVLFFKNNQSTDDAITCQNGKIKMVNFNIIDTLNRANDWSKGSGSGSSDNDFIYNVVGSTITITGFTGSEDINNVTIPETIDGKPVVAIGKSAFRGKNIHYVTIPDSVTSIGNYAFYSNGLYSVTIPDSVTSIGDYAFSHNHIDIVTIGNSVTHIGYDAFYRNALSSVTIPDSVTSIGDYAFYQNYQLTSVTIGANVMLNDAFGQASNCNDCVSFKTAYTNANKAAGTYTATRSDMVMTWSKR